MWNPALEDSDGPIIAATDYIQVYADQIRGFVPRSYHVLGTDGFGRSDTRVNLRQFFEVNRNHVVATALNALKEEGKMTAKKVEQALKKLEIDPR